jgi:uncharacterized protein (TIRG00374 family)
MEIKSRKILKLGSENIWKRVITILFRIIVSTIVLYFIISLVKWQNVLAAYSSANEQYIILGVLLIFANLGIRTLKWRTMLHAVKKSPAVWESFGSVMLGISLGSFTPGEIGEFAGRALHISDAKKSHLIGLALLDKAQIFVVTSACGAISLSMFALKISLLPLLVDISLLVISFLFFVRMDFLAAVGHRLNSSFFQKSWLTRILDGFTLLHRKQVYVTLLYTLIFHGVLVLQMYFFIQAFSDITLFHAFIGTSAMMFVKSCLPVSLGDLGIREAGSIFFFSSFGISQAAALNASLLLFVANVLFPSVFGIIFLKHQHLTVWSLWKSFRSKTRP